MLKDHIIENGYKLRCRGCKKNLYKYIGDFSDTIMAEDFIPLTKKIPKPQNYTYMVCPLCDSTLADEIC